MCSHDRAEMRALAYRIGDETAYTSGRARPRRVMSHHVAYDGIVCVVPARERVVSRRRDSARVSQPPFRIE